VSSDRSAAPSWKWRTFPVFAALVVGLTIGSFVDGRPDTDIGVVVRVVALAGFAYVLIHLFVMNVIVAGRIKRRQQIIDAGEDGYEDVVLHPEDEV
jgi:hypothetical protein